MIIKLTDSVNQCDLYPFGSLWEGEKDENGIKVRRASWIPPSFGFKVLEAMPEKTKECPNCKNKFEQDHPFVDRNQINEDPLCLRCFEKFHVIGGRENYRQVMREEILMELKLKKND